MHLHIKRLGVAIALLLAAGCAAQPEIEATVAHEVALAVTGTLAARPSTTAYPTATLYSTVTFAPTMPPQASPTPLPTHTPYATATPYPTFTAEPSPSPTATRPAPTGGGAWPQPTAPPADPAVVLLDIMYGVRAQFQAFNGYMNGAMEQTSVDCQRVYAHRDELVAAPIMDESDAPLDVQAAYGGYRNILESYLDILAELVLACDSHIANGSDPANLPWNNVVQAVHARTNYKGAELSNVIQSLGGE